MKKIIALVALFVVGTSGLASDLSQLTFSFSTPGPDVYADGTPVVVGETYLLVYVNVNHEFGGVRTDGTLVDPVNNCIVTRSYAIAGSKCGYKAFQYPAGTYAEGGSWVVVLLDTRDDAGVVGSLVAAQGVSSKQRTQGGSTLNSLQARADGAGLNATQASMALANVPAPVITAVVPQGNTANVRFKNFRENALYTVESTSDLAANNWQPANQGARVQGKRANAVIGAGGAEELPVTVTVPENDKVRFFRVIVPSGN